MPDSSAAARPLTGVILAGGLSERFGSDKASALLAGRPLLQWVAAALEPVCAQLVIVRAAGQSLPVLDAVVPLSVVEDPEPARGPLLGAVAGFRAAAPGGLAFLTSCDVPLLSPGVVAAIVRAIGAHAAAVPDVDGHHQPLVAAYRIEAALPAFEDAYRAGQSSLRAALERLDIVSVPAAALMDADPALASFRNANTPEALADIEALLRAR